MSAVTAFGEPDQVLRVHRDVPAALARAAQHAIPMQRRAVDDGRQRLALAERGDAADDVAGGAFGRARSAIVALGTPSAAAAALSDSLDGTGSTATARPFGHGDDQRLEDLLGVRRPRRRRARRRPPRRTTRSAGRAWYAAPRGEPRRPAGP